MNLNYFGFSKVNEFEFLKVNEFEFKNSKKKMNGSNPGLLNRVYDRSIEWIMENFSMELKIIRMKWKKIASMEHRKIVFHSILCLASQTKI